MPLQRFNNHGPGDDPADCAASSAMVSRLPRSLKSCCYDGLFKASRLGNPQQRRSVLQFVITIFCAVIWLLPGVGARSMGRIVCKPLHHMLFFCSCMRIRRILHLAKVPIGIRIMRALETQQIRKGSTAHIVSTCHMSLPH